MNNNIRAFMLVLFVFINGVAEAQIGNVYGSMNKPLTLAEQYRKTEGSPYYFEDYVSGKIIDKQGRAKDVVLKYDTYRDEVEILHEGQVLLINQDIYPKFVIQTIDEKQKKVLNLEFDNSYSLPDQTKNTYAQVIFEGNGVKILKTTHTELIKNTDPGYGGVIPPDRFEKRMNYYIVLKSGNIVEVKLSNKSVINALSDDGIKSYLKKNKIKIKNEEDLESIIDYF